jgi:4-oxalmesaconate hydratase
MAHHIGDFNVSSTWAAICNELCYRVSTLFPDHFVPVAMLPQSPGVDPATCIPELEKCVKEYGAVGINLNPDPSGGHWTSPPLTDKHWYPIYEKMVEYDLPAMIHVSTSCNACFHTTGAHYLNADTTAFMQLIQGDLFKDFPTLKFLIPHGGGAVPYHWGRFRGLAQEMKKPLLQEHLLNNVFFDTCVYHQPGIDLLNTVIPVKNVLFASEMIGAVRGIDPTTGHYYDDTKRYIEASTILSADEMNNLGIVKRNITRADKAAVDKLSRFGVATIHEAMGRVGLMKPYMRPIYNGGQDLRHRGDRAAAARRQLDDARGGRADPARRRGGGRLHHR